MKILIVDDNEARSTRLAEYLISHVGVGGADIDVRADGLSARDALGVQAYDLLVLDVVLPYRLGEAPGELAAVSLLTELSEKSSLKRPGHIIGLTAFEAAEQRVASDLLSRSWVLIREDGLNDDWLTTVGNAVAYLREHENAADSRGHLVDVVLVAALQLEMDAIRRLPWDWLPDEALDQCQFISKGEFRSGGAPRTVVAAVSNRMGMVSAALLASKLIHRFRPRLVIMPGICAGVRGRVGLGDVVCADMSWDYQSGKHVSVGSALDGFQMDPHFIQADAFVLSRAEQLAQDIDYSFSVWRDGGRPGELSPPKLIRGPIASGSAVLADANVTDRIRLQQRKLLAIEMELYGVFLAAEQARKPKPIVVGMKAVCDFADDEKSDAIQQYASYASAAYVKEFCERYTVDL